MESREIVRRARAESKLSVRGLADAAGVATSTVHRIERGDLQPTVDTLARIVQAAGFRLSIDAQVDYAASVVGLARSIEPDVAGGDYATAIRKAAEFGRRFASADSATRARMITARPARIGDPRWDALVGGLAEWLAVRAGQPAPAWVREDDRYLHRGWWVTPMTSMHAWEYAGSPMSFQSRGVYLHRDSLVNV